MKNFVAIVAAILALNACAIAPVSRLADGPSLSPPGDPNRPLPPARLAYATNAPSASDGDPATGTASLWRSSPEALFGDRRARAAGDLVTVVIEINDQAQLRNRTDLRREAEENIAIPALLGVNALAARALPGGAGLDPAVEASSASRTRGDGLIQRSERIALRVAATVVDVLPNGHLVIAGSQEIRVNQELRDLQVAGVIRPEDILRTNVIAYDKVAEARISYGGRGPLTAIQRSRYGQKIINVVSPF